MRAFVYYLLISDALMAILFLITTWLDTERTIEARCNQAGISINTLVVVGSLLGFIFLPFTIVTSITNIINKKKGE